MTKNLESADTTVVRFDAPDQRFDQTSIMFHWVTVVLIVVQFASIWARESLTQQIVSLPSFCPCTARRVF